MTQHVDILQNPMRKSGLLVLGQEKQGGFPELWSRVDVCPAQRLDTPDQQGNERRVHAGALGHRCCPEVPLRIPGGVERRDVMHVRK